MSDGQAFLLLFGCFYLIECFALAPPGHVVYVRRWTGRFRRRQPVLEFGGIRKQVYFLYFLPYPGRAHVFPAPDAEALKVRSAAPRIEPYLRVLNRAADGLAVQGAVIWLVFFIFIPILYYSDPMGLGVRIMIGIGYLFLWWQTVSFFCLHGRFFPSRREDRLKDVLTMIALPWHGMRAADRLALRPAQSLPALHLDAVLLDEADFQSRAARAWRRAIHDPSVSPAARTALAKFLESRGLHLDDLAAPPAPEPDLAYCPVCHQTYEAWAESCADCHGIPLLRRGPH